MSNKKEDPWQQVGKTKVQTKHQQQNALKKMPKVKDLDFATAQSLLYQYDADDVGEPLRDTSNVQKQSGNKFENKQTNKKKFKKPAAEPKFSYKSIKEALEKDNLNLEDKLDQIKNTFPDKPSVWLKEVSTYLNLFLTCPEESLTANDKPLDFPLSHANKKTVSTLRRLYTEDVKKSAVPPLFHQYVMLMLDCIARDIPAWGYRLCIQTLAHNYPKLCCEDLSKYKQKVSSSLNIPKQCIALLWAFGQTCKNSLECGLKVWLELILPHLHVRQVSQHAIPYLEHLLKKSKNPERDLGPSFQVSHYLEIAKWCFADVVVAKGTGPTRDQLRKFYPTFEKILLSPKNNLRRVFTELLERPSDETEQLKEAICKVQFNCLINDPSCFKAWRENYEKKNLIQSNVLLSYIDRNWEVANEKLSLKPFKETMRIFLAASNDGESRGNYAADVTEFKRLCEILHARVVQPEKQKLSRVRGVLVAIMFAVLASLVGYIRYDVQSHGGVWEQSDTYRFLKTNGVISFADHVSGRLQHLWVVSSSWISKNVPIYWRTVSEMLGPYFSELQSYVQSLSASLLKASRPMRISIGQHAAVVIQYVAELFKIAAWYFLEGLDVAIVMATDVAVWSWKYMNVLYQSIEGLYRGEITWDDVKESARFNAAILYEYVLYYLRIVGDYIAPDEPGATRGSS